MSNVVIVDAVRTPIGKRNGGLSTLHPAEVLATVQRAVVDRTGIDPAAVDDVVFGSALQQGHQAGNIARTSLLRAGLPVTVSASSTFRIDAGSKLEMAAFDLAAIGEVPFAAMKDKALHLNSLRLVGRYDGVTGHLALTTADMNAKEARALFKGAGDFFYDATGKLERVHAELSARDVALDMPGVFPGAVGYQSVSVAADYLAGPRQFNFTRMAVDAPGFALEGSGTLVVAEIAFCVRINGLESPHSVGDARALAVHAGVVAFVMVPKLERPEQVAEIRAVVGETCPPIWP